MSLIAMAVIGVVAILLLATQNVSASTVADCCTGGRSIVIKLSLSDAATQLAMAMAGFETGTLENFNPYDSSAWQGMAPRYNNPGNLRVAGAEAQYQSPAAGFEAMIRDIEAKIQGHTVTGLGPTSSIADLINVWTDTPGDRPAYINFVSSRLNVDANAPFNSWIEV